MSRKYEYTAEQLVTIRRDIFQSTSQAHERAQRLLPQMGMTQDGQPWDLGKVHHYVIDGLMAERHRLDVLVPIQDDIGQHDLSDVELESFVRRWHRHLMRQLLNGDFRNTRPEKVRAMQDALRIFEDA